MNKEKDTPPSLKCPICNTPSDHHYHPFCSKRCADIDLNRWLSGVYKIETDESCEDALTEENE